MTAMSDAQIWLTIVLLGIGTFLIRFSFLGLIGDRDLPEWVLRYLRYTPVAVLPALIAPLVVWPEATGGQPDPARLGAAAVTALVGYFTKNVLLAICCGGITLYGMIYGLGA
ncbi:AzlD branched-chain amino acid transport [Actibacterium atlanticum]|uniref:AzlD branched-chain amino acid transport n=1 Tax=Actibacterium atlanticum TaxID=1461693 RepID=A0A058ZJ35_9RHOB|nr:AzlD domain-containing protein [Actibacterium atlanticum]KCV80796.1 AzlD branched-chain amino acid transport [Actibacterium atlanticum]